MSSSGAEHTNNSQGENAPRQAQQQYQFLYNFDDSENDPQGILDNGDDVDLPLFFWDLEETGPGSDKSQANPTNGEAQNSSSKAESSTSNSSKTGQEAKPDQQDSMPPQAQQIPSLAQQQHQDIQRQQQQQAISQTQPSSQLLNTTSRNMDPTSASTFLADLAQQIAAHSHSSPAGTHSVSNLLNTVANPSSASANAPGALNINGFPLMIPPAQQIQSVVSAPSATALTQPQTDMNNYQQAILRNPTAWNINATPQQQQQQQGNMQQQQQLQHIINSVNILPKHGQPQQPPQQQPQQPQSQSQASLQEVKQNLSRQNSTNNNSSNNVTQPSAQNQQQPQPNQFFALAPPPPLLHQASLAGIHNLQPTQDASQQQAQQQQLQLFQQLQQANAQQLDISQMFPPLNLVSTATTTGAHTHPSMLPPQQQFQGRASVPQQQGQQQQQQQGQQVNTPPAPSTAYNPQILPPLSQVVPPAPSAAPGTTTGPAPAPRRGQQQRTTPIAIAQQSNLDQQQQSNQNNSSNSVPSRKRQLQSNGKTPTDACTTTPSSNQSKIIVSCSEAEGEGAVKSSPATKKTRRGNGASTASSSSPLLDQLSSLPSSTSNITSINGRKSKDQKTLPGGLASNSSSSIQVPDAFRTQSQIDGLAVDSTPMGVTSSSDSTAAVAAGLLSSASERNRSDTAGEDEMTEEERAHANRLRNREHARNTRARKKAYLEALKSTLERLCQERDALVTERAGAASLLVEMQKTRVDVLLSYFALRSCYKKQRSLWSSILDESVTCVMPVTPYRSFPASEVQVSKCQRTIMGIDGVIADTASLHVLLNSLVDRSRFADGTVQFKYTVIAEEAVVSGNQMMARWSMSTLNLKELGAKREVDKLGMLCARFNSAHKIVGIDLMFDVMAFMLQLKQSAGASAFNVVPNTVQTCLGPFGKSPMVMTLAERPYTIVQVNQYWEEMTGWKAEDVVGKASCKILQGQCTERGALDELMSSIRYKRPASAVITNYVRKRSKKFRNFINVFPLSTDSKISHYVALTVHVDWLDSGSVHEAESVKNQANENSCAEGKVHDDEVDKANVKKNLLNASKEADNFIVKTEDQAKVI